MAAVTDLPAGTLPAGSTGSSRSARFWRPGRPAQSRGPRRRPAVWRWAILLLAAVFFLVPLAASLEFALHGKGGHYSFDSFRAIFSRPGFGESLWMSVKLGLIAVVLTLALLIPTMTLVHLRFPWLRRVVETISVLPLVIPPVVLVVGVLDAFREAPQWLIGSPNLLGLEYVVLALPFAYRSLDAGISAVDLRTLVEASRSLGGGWATELFRVVLPNLRTAVLNACVLTLALVLGEFAMASLLLWATFPVWVVQVAQTEAGVSVAVSLLALVLTWLILMVLITVGGRRGRATVLGGMPGE